MRDQPTGLLKEWNDDEAVREQVLVFANRGYYHGEQMRGLSAQASSMVEVRDSHQGCSKEKYEVLQTSCPVNRLKT